MLQISFAKIVTMSRHLVVETYCVEKVTKLRNGKNWSVTTEAKPSTAVGKIAIYSALHSKERVAFAVNYDMPYDFSGL